MGRVKELCGGRPYMCNRCGKWIEREELIHIKHRGTFHRECWQKVWATKKGDKNGR